MRSAFWVCGVFATVTGLLAGCGENNEAPILRSTGTTKVEATGTPPNSMDDYAKQRQTRADPYATGGYPGSKSKAAPAKK